MAKYYRQHGESKRRKFMRFLRPVVLTVFAAAIGLLGLLAYDIFTQKDAAETASQLSTPVSSTIIANKEIHTTPYFQFQSPERWRAVANETREGHYVYRQYNGALVEQELVVDTNNQQSEVLALTQITRVLPLVVSGNGFQDLSNPALEHCKKAVKPGTEKTQQIVTMNSVTFPCNPDTSAYVVVAGTENGTNIMALPRPNGETAYYKILYRNVSASPSPRDLFNIIETFETR